MLEYTLQDFSDHILRGHDPPEAYAQIEEYKRYRVKSGLQHQYLVMHVVHDDPRHSFWIRLDRSGDQTRRSRSTSILPPCDRVSRSSDDHH